jgi:hypothetical protein
MIEDKGLQIRAAVLETGIREDSVRLKLLEEDARARQLGTELGLHRHGKTSEDQHVQLLVRGILPQLPSSSRANGSEAESYEQKCREGADELDREYQKFCELMDAIKGVLMWVEAPEQRVRENRSLAGDGP